MADVTFMIGSGFSRDVAGHPTLEELSRALDEIDLPDGNVFLSKTPRPIRGNLEHLLTYLHQQYPWRDRATAALAEAVFIQVLQRVREILTAADLTVDVDTQGAAAQLIRRWHRDEATVISFNYDTLVERLALATLLTKSATTGLEHHLLPAYRSLTLRIASDYAAPVDRPIVGFDEATREIHVVAPDRDLPLDGSLNKFGEDHGLSAANMTLITSSVGQLRQRCRASIPLSNFYGIPVASLQSRTAAVLGGSRSPTLQLLKLHGSTNWYCPGTTSGAGHEIYYDKLIYRDRDEEFSFRMHAMGLEPLIIPPLLDKGSVFLGSGLRAQSRLASEALERAKTLCVIGYSLPETDLHTRFLLTEALAKSRADLHLFTKCDVAQEGQLKSRYLDVVDGDESRLAVTNVDPEGSSIKAVNDWLRGM